MAEKTVKLGIIGCSQMVYDFLYDCTKRYPIRLVAVCDDEQGVRKFTQRYACPAAYGDYRQMLEREHPDLVLSFSAALDQFEVARDCLTAGAHVYAERPVCRGATLAEKLAQLERETGRWVMARLNRRFLPTYRMAREIISRAEFGTPKMYLAKYHASPYESEDVFIWNHTIHHLDLARYLLGELEITHVDRTYVDPKRVGYNISFRAQSGCVGVLQTGSLQWGEYPMERVEITGDRRNVIADNVRFLQYNRPAPGRQALASMRLEDGGDALSINQNFAQLDNFTYYGFENSFEHFADCILSGKKPELTMGDTVHTIELVEKLYQIVHSQIDRP